MILKELRISRQLSQDQLAQISGLNVRTIQRIESGQNASLESIKCLASALDVAASTLNQEKFLIDKKSDNWKNLPSLLKIWFMFNFLQSQPKRQSALRIEVISQISGFIFCCFGLLSEAALVGGLLMLANAHLFQLLKWQGDLYGVWYDVPSMTNN